MVDMYIYIHMYIYGWYVVCMWYMFLLIHWWLDGSRFRYVMYIARNPPTKETSCVEDVTESGQFITTSAEVTANGGLVRESPPKWP